jgi:hypothetical protein
MTMSKLDCKLYPAALWLGFSLFLALPRAAQAEDVAFVICDVALFSCPEGDIVAGSLAQLIPNNLLGANRYIVQPVKYDDLQGLVDFTGTFVTADSGGKFIYAWGTGTATATAGMANLYLDVSIRQRYVTVPGLWSFGEMLNATCDPNAVADSSSIGFQGQVNNANLPVLGPMGDCAATNIVASAGPFTKTVGTVTTMIAGAQFFFPAGGNFNQIITLPFGDDFPNPSINFNDPNNPLNFITNLDIPDGFTQDANVPEPSYVVLLAAGMSGLRFLRARPRRVSRC